MTDGRDARQETEEAARTGRFPDADGKLEDDSNPIEPQDPPRDDARESDGPPVGSRGLSTNEAAL